MPRDTFVSCLKVLFSLRNNGLAYIARPVSVQKILEDRNQACLLTISTEDGMLVVYF